ncbi:F420-0--gamma-glutamyl ligase, partial [bacterium]|nr:F420-0--gamma-glutamyl ligase [bacterium]NIO73748.1 F420-0--gamma-glutamyl ligase [bacterium]
LPKDPDGMAKELKKGFDERTGRRVGVVIADSFGRPFRFGSVGVAIGAAGVPTLWDRRGEEDLFGRRLETTRVAVADLLASAANLVTGDASEGIPVA